MTEARATRPIPPAAIPVRARDGWMLLALLPGFALQCLAFGPPWAWRTSGLLALVVVVDDAWHRWRREPDPDPHAVLMAALALCWLSAAVPGWASALAALTAWGISRAFHSAGGSPFHPAMAGAALALLLAAPSAVDDGVARGAWPAALAFTVTGAILAGARVLRWQVALAGAMGGGALAAAWLALGAPAPPRLVVLTALPATALVVFFIAGDPPSGCRSAPVRTVSALALGVLGSLALLAGRTLDRALLGLAGAVLLLDACAPWLDRHLAGSRQRRPATP